MISYDKDTYTLKIENEINISLFDIYNNSSSDIKDIIIIKNDNSYYINANLELISTSLVDTNISLIIENEIFHFDKNSSIHLENSYIYMPNVNFLYGFGNDRVNDITQNGDLTLINCLINIWGFWGLFNDKTIILKNNLIIGYGRIAGINSICDNNIIIKANGKYGGISYKGTIKSFFNNKILDIILTDGNKSPIYFNPNFANGMKLDTIFANNYNQILYLQQHNVSDANCEIINYMIDKEDIKKDNIIFNNSKAKITFSYKFKFIIKDENDNNINNCNIKIFDNMNNNIKSFTGNSIDEILPYAIITETSENFIPYYFIEISDDTKTIKYKLETKPYNENIYLINIQKNDTTSLDEVKDLLNTINNKVDINSNNISDIKNNTNTIISNIDTQTSNIIDEINNIDLSAITNKLDTYKTNIINEIISNMSSLESVINNKSDEISNKIDNISIDTSKLNFKVDYNFIEDIVKKYFKELEKDLISGYSLSV